MSTVKDTLISYLPPKAKKTPTGWYKFNAPCCIHNGDSQDTKQRGGVVGDPDGSVSYHCFNCGYKANWQPGRTLSYKMRKLMQWLFIPDEVINQVALQVLRENEEVEVGGVPVKSLPVFEEKSLPEGAKPIEQWSLDENEYLIKIVEYMRKRQLYLEDYDFYWSPATGFRNRLIIPFKNEGKIVGYTARAVNDESRSKYLSDQQPGYVFNIDSQRDWRRQYCIIFEGPIEAIYLDALALLGSEIKDQQSMLINHLNKTNIVVPDRDSAGEKLIEQAIDNEWMVSMPSWDETVNDPGDAVLKYGRLYTMHSIVTEAESSPLKIRLRAKKWFG